MAITVGQMYQRRDGWKDQAEVTKIENDNVTFKYKTGQEETVTRAKFEQLFVEL